MMRKATNSKTAVLIALAGVLLLVAFAFRDPANNKNSGEAGPRKLSEAKTYTIVETDDGFSPKELTILAGDTVTFATKRPKSFWPASDPHPTHEYLAGFDPKQALTPGESWNFTFREPGTWRFHDHLDVSLRGEITVLNEKAERVVRAQNAEGYCSGECFDTLIKETVEREGIDAAYTLFREAFAEGKLPVNCHWTAHQIGEAAYELYRKGVKFPISYATSYCGFGFYHGFLEGLLRENPDPAYALSFCDRVREELGSLGVQNCYHGIGHGYTEDPPDPRTQGDFNAMLKPGIKMCEFLFGKNFQYLNLCLTGVYTVPAGFAQKHRYGLSFDPKDPFKYCKDQPYRYLKACYGEFAPKLDSALFEDMRGLRKYVDDISDEKLKRLVTWVVPSVLMARDVHSNDQSKYVGWCREAFEDRLRRICWGGTILGFFLHDEPEKQYIKLLKLCASSAWQGDERDFCYGETFRQMRQNYTLDKVKEVCLTAPGTYRHWCLDAERKHISPYDDPSFDT